MLHFMTSVSAFQDVAMYSYNLPNLTGLRDLRALPMSELHWLTPLSEKPLQPGANKKAGHLPGVPPDDSIRDYSIAFST